MNKYLSFTLILILLWFGSSCHKRPVSLKIGIIKPSTDHLPLSYLFHKGFEGMDAYELIYFSSGWELQEALIAGKADMGIMPFSFAFNAASKGYPIAITSFFERESDGLVALNKYSSLKDLNSKKIGVLRASTVDVLTIDLAKKEGFSYEPVYFRTPNEMIAALQSEEVDAIVAYVPLLQKIGDQFNVLHFFGSNYPAHPCCDICVNTKTLTAPKLALYNELMQQLPMAIAKVNSREADLMQYMMDSFGLSLAQANEALDHTVFQLGLDLQGIDFQMKMGAIAVEQGYQTKVLSASEIYWEKN